MRFWRAIRLTLPVLTLIGTAPAHGEAPRAGDGAAGHGRQADGSPVVPEALEGVIREVVSACLPEIETYCSTVNPGEGRISACLLAHDDKLSDACGKALDRLERPDLTPRLRATALYPSLEERQLGQPNLDAEGNVVVWGRALPFLAQDVVELGFDLPNPYGVTVIPTWIQQELVLQDLAISINDGPFTEIDFVDFGVPQVENRSLQVKLDAWLLPFVNVFATVGWFEGQGTIPITIEGEDLFPDVCSTLPNLPACVRTYSAIARPGYHGQNLTLGTNLAMGWDRFFVALPIAYAWTDVDIIDTTVTALNVAPRIGVTGDVGDYGVIATFVGAAYLSAEVDLAGSVMFDTSDGPDGGTTTVGFRVNQRNRDRWSYLLGFSWDIDKSWSVVAEAGFGGSRQSFICGATYRF